MVTLQVGLGSGVTGGRADSETTWSGVSETEHPLLDRGSYSLSLEGT